jgi:tryptophan-rich sensory protein
MNISIVKLACREGWGKQALLWMPDNNYLYPILYDRIPLEKIKMDSTNNYSQLKNLPVSARLALWSVWTILYIISPFRLQVFIMASQEAPLHHRPSIHPQPCFQLRLHALHGLKNLLLSSIDILLVLVTLIWATAAIYPYAAWITYIQIPYLLWVSFATILQLTITWLNK